MSTSDGQSHFGYGLLKAILTVIRGAEHRACAIVRVRNIIIIIIIIIIVIIIIMFIRLLTQLVKTQERVK